MLINTLLMVTDSFKIYYLQRYIAKRHVKVDKEICYRNICQSANKAYVKVIEACCKTAFVLSQLPCINTYIKYITEKSHKKIVHYAKCTLDSIVGAEQFAGP